MATSLKLERCAPGHSARRREWSRPRELSPPERLGRAPPNRSARPARHGGVPGLRTPYVKDAGFTVQCSHPCCSHSRCMAPRTRFERATPGFVGQCSDPIELTREGNELMKLADAERVERSCRRSRPRRSTAELSRRGGWRSVRELNPWLPPGQGGTLAAELTDHCMW